MVQKQIKFLGNLLLFIISILGLLIVNYNPEMLDDIILLERRNPGLTQLMSGCVLGCDSTRTSNMLHIICNSISSQGMQIQCKQDGRIILNGKNVGDDLVLNIALENNIPNGSYYLNDGGASSDQCFLYCDAIEKTSQEKVIQHSIAKLPERSVVKIDNELYGRYWFGLYVKAGAKLDNVVFYPCLDSSKVFSPAWSTSNSNNQIYWATISSEVIITNDDRRKFLNYLKHQFPGCKTAYIDYLNSTWHYKQTEVMNVN